MKSQVGLAAVVMITAVLSFPGVGGAQTLTCRSIESDLDRLACYDRESGRAPVADTAPTTSAWRARTEKSEMTDQTSVYLSVEALEPVSCSFTGSEKPTLIVRCLENTTAIFMASACHLVSSEYNRYGDVTYRLDDEPSKTRGFDESTDNKALGLWSGGTSIPFIKAMLGKRELLMRFTPFKGSPQTAKFPIAGLEDVIGPLREACGW